MQLKRASRLINRFGSNLELMPVPDRLILRTVLSQFVYGIRFLDGGYDLQQAIDDCIPPDFAVSGELEEAAMLLNGISAPQADNIISSITIQIQALGGKK